MRFATWRGSSDRDSALLMSSSWRSSAARRRVSATCVAPVERGRGLVGEDQQQPQVVVVELAQAELGERDHADQPVVVRIGTTSIDSSTSSVPGDRLAARVARRVVDEERRSRAGRPSR